MSKFENPYNFVPALPREQVTGPLGDARPAGHGRYQPDLWSGRIAVRLTTETPLLLVDASLQLEKEKDHKTYGMRKNADGRPYLPPTSLRGMLRAAFEAVTNSRMGVFEAHDKKLELRKPTTAGNSRTVRGQFDNAPVHLLGEGLQPARNLAELSPADRVFGWVKGNGNEKKGSAYKGQLRIGATKCLTDDAIENLGATGVPLAILGQPKPAQAGFYCAADRQGAPLSERTPKAGGYKPGHGLRGRKVYIHHRLTVDDPKAPLGTLRYWDAGQSAEAPLERKKITIYREWRRVGNVGDGQNRSICEWIKPQTAFRFDIQVSNLSDVELGALLWLLQLPGNHFFRLGGGKPLGFGSVRLEIENDGIDLCNGEAMAANFRDLLNAATKGERITTLADCEAPRAVFEEALKQAYVEPAKKNNILQAFLNAAKGSNLPVHYPRRVAAPCPEAKIFDWFVDNEKAGKRTLPQLWDEERSLEL
jgi:CRISPR/Cas system CSM-associated protein Csm3 (group 7 of RAMP superfamily)